MNKILIVDASADNRVISGLLTRICHYTACVIEIYN